MPRKTLEIALAAPSAAPKRGPTGSLGGYVMSRQLSASLRAAYDPRVFARRED
jgi:hypothetical protein